MSRSPDVHDPALASTFVFTTEGTLRPADNASQETSGVPASEVSVTAKPESPVPPERERKASLEALNRTKVWDVPFDQVTMSGAVQRIAQLIERAEPSYVITANLNYVMLHHRRPDLRPITEAADLILADGQPIVWRSKLGRGRLPQRVAGSEMIYHLAHQAAANGWGIYFLGGQPGVAATCAERLADLYPGLRIAGVESPPYRDLTPQEQAAQDERIRASDAQILLVAFGQPKGESWIHEHYKRLGVPVSIQLGASFDFIAGTAKRAPVIWQRLGLEWAYRMMSDPRRLVPRYASNASFLLGVLMQDWKRKVTSWGMGDWAEKP